MKNLAPFDISSCYSHIWKPQEATLEVFLIIGRLDFIAVEDYPNGNTRTDSISYYFGNEKTAIVNHTGQNQPDMRLVFNAVNSTITPLFAKGFTNGSIIL